MPNKTKDIVTMTIALLICISSIISTASFFYDKGYCDAMDEIIDASECKPMCKLKFRKNTK